MAVLSDPDRFDLWKEIMSDDNTYGTFEIPKNDIRTAVNEADSWLDTTGSVTINGIFTEPFKSSASSTQQLLLLARTILKRAEKGLI